ncbi:MAG: HU family DNA-binding protein [Phycisphaeraceae bacterium]|nr:HU family DNA-binding protein [Phycisphaeraceae bacterium]
MAKKSATGSKAPTKSEVYSAIAETTGLSKKQVAGVVAELSEVAVKSLKKNGLFAMPGLCKMVVKKKPATKARKGRNPFTGQEIMIKAKPASKTVRIRALKGLKDAIA